MNTTREAGPSEHDKTTAPNPESELDRLRSTLKQLGPAAVLAGVTASVPALGGFVLLYFIKDVGSWLRDHGTQGVTAYAAGFAVLTGLALLPTYVSAILGGWAFGLAGGLPAALVGILVGSLIGYLIARPTASARADAVLAGKPRWKAVRDALVGSGYLRTLLIVTLLRLPPNSPFAMTNLVLASVRVPLSAYLIATLVGMVPRTAAVMYFASLLHDRLDASQLGDLKHQASEVTPVWVFVVGIIVTLIVLGIVGKIAQQALEKVTGVADGDAR